MKVCAAKLNEKNKKKPPQNDCDGDYVRVCVLRKVLVTICVILTESSR